MGIPVTKSGSGKGSNKTTTTKKSSGGGGGGGGGGSGIRKTNDKPQVRALNKLIKSSIGKAYRTRVANIQATTAQGDASLLESYAKRAGLLTAAQDRNDAAEAGANYSAVANRNREAGDVLSQVVANGAGETDLLVAQRISAQNANENLKDVSRSFQDSRQSSNQAITELNQDTKGSRYNLYNNMLGDLDAAYTEMKNKKVDAYTQLGNISSNPYSNAYSKKRAKKAWKRMASWESKTYENPGVDPSVTGWEGSTQAKDQQLNSSLFREDAAQPKRKRPEGSTIKPWNGDSGA